MFVSFSVYPMLLSILFHYSLYRLGFPKLNVRLQLLTNNRDSYSLKMEFLSWWRVWVYPSINLNVVVCSPHIINHQGAVTICSFTHYWGTSFELVFHLMRLSSVIHYRILCSMVLVPFYPRMRFCMTWHHNTAPLNCGHCFGYSDVPASHLLEHWDAFVW